ncbi:hypothetical protein GPECTOR_12g588 [Gonium pectorale]|uniref:phytol kinase n=1 Tax=Gonium pectorale TaxID=33097 RepID=A0A150GP95_GONPE|nr:hypothetical protein GPECTOR_12g588 [Gonium pectorale]|eukprot:KXZ51624.1 hypothetical protein GPECTOR_12g588 [Gonium pectorale]
MHADCLRRAASGRCAQHAALCLGLAVLCDADGGPAYGLPPELLAVLPTDMQNDAVDFRTLSRDAARQLQGMAAALLATLRKLLRTVGPGAMLADRAPQDSSHQAFLQAAFDVLREGPLLDKAGAVPEQGLSPASQQLLRLLCHAACEWLPELARAVLSEETSGALSAGVPVHILRWLQLLATCCASQPGTPESCPPAHDATAGATVVSGILTAASNGGEAVADGGEAVADDGEAAAGDGDWRVLLLEEVGAVPLLDAALRRLIRHLSGASEDRRPYLRCLVDSCRAVAAVFTGLGPPAADANTGLPGNGTSGRADATQVVWDGREAEGPAMAFACAAAGPASAASGTPARPPLPWRPELLREAANQLRSRGEHGAAANAEALAAYLERGGRGACEMLRTPLREPWVMASALPPPVEARRLLPGRCANPACANLDGDSEVDLKLLSCAGCGAVGYCCRPCQLEHWRAGHKDACGGMRGSGA